MMVAVDNAPAVMGGSVLKTSVILAARMWVLFCVVTCYDL